MSNTKTSMLTGAPQKALLLFALPMILGNLFQQFYNIIDSVIVGKFVGEAALASVGASYSITMIFIAVATGGGIGCSVIIAQYLGSRQLSAMKTAITTALISILGISVLMGIIGFLFSSSILQWLNVPGNVFSDAFSYLRIYFCGLPFLFMYNVLASIFNALGDSRTPLALLIFSSVLNVILDLIFVIGFNMGVPGVAYATLLAQGMSAVISFLLLAHKVKGFDTPKGIPLYSPKTLLSMVRIAIPSIIQQSIVSVGMLLVQSVVNGFGSSVLAGYTAASRIDSISIMPMIAVGNAMSTFTAQNVGAGKTERIKEGYRACFLIIVTIAAITFVILRLFGTGFIGGFLGEGDSRTAFETASSYIGFISFFYVFLGLKATSDGLLRGAGDVFVFTFANLVNLTIRVFVSFALAGTIGVKAAWISMPIGWAANFIISSLRCLTGKWKNTKVI